MADKLYKTITVVGTSPYSWEKAAANAVAMASRTLHDLRIAEVEELDLQIDSGRVTRYRARLRLSFKYQGDD